MTKTGWIRLMAYGTGLLFLLSWAFPVGAALTKDASAFPKWWGPVDVTSALFLGILAFAIQIQRRGKVGRQAEHATYRVYRTVTHGIIAVAVLAVLAGDRISWANCATGFLWRAWLGLYMLPSWLAAVG